MMIFLILAMLWVDLVHAQARPDHHMLVDACYVEGRLAPIVGYAGITVENAMMSRAGGPEYALVIRYVRAYAPERGSVGAPRAGRYGQVYMVDRDSVGEERVRTSPYQDSATGARLTVSTLWPGERCTMWLPPPPAGYTRWMVVVERVRSVRAGDGSLMYVRPTEKPWCQRTVLNTGRYTFSESFNWTQSPP